MPIKIEGTEFELFWDVDRDRLKGLSFTGRTEWLEQRVSESLLKPLNALSAVESTTSVSLAITELICAGIQSLASFYRKRFCDFVRAFMDQDFSTKQAKNIDGKDWTYCDHLRMYFRNGLDHGFAIEWGGLWLSGEDGTVGYLRSARNGEGIAIDFRMLLSDFRHAVDKYFALLRREGESSTIGKNFQNRFENLLQQRGKRY